MQDINPYLRALSVNNSMAVRSNHLNKVLSVTHSKNNTMRGFEKTTLTVG
jgi:hypothetical protein